MIEFLVFVVALAADQLVKYWSMLYLKPNSEEFRPIIEGFLWFFYKENTGESVSFIRGRSAFMTVIRVLQVALVLYLVIKKRKQLKTITRVALMMFLAGMIGNQLNYMLMDYVPDMLYCMLFPGIVFNVADVLVFAAMIILFIRMAFFEGQDLINWVFDRGKKKTGDQAPIEALEAHPGVAPLDSANEQHEAADEDLHGDIQ